MKQLPIFFLLLGLTAPGLAGEKKELTWTNFNDGLEQAKKNEKHLLIDVYTSWCGWCKKMDKDVYGNDSVAQYLNQHFILVKLDAESQEKVTYNGKPLTERALAEYFGVAAYPTTVFLESDGKLVSPVEGYIEAETFLDVTKFIGESLYKKMTWKEYQSKTENSIKK